jgi:putative Mn2+ efflux pump MntP
MGFFNQKICFLINGIFLIILGLIYIFETNKKTPKILNLKNSIFECFIISVDAIFTALFSGYFLQNHFFYIFLYYIFNFFAIFFGNRLFYKFSKFSKLNLCFFSGFIFIFLGIFKIFGI